MAMSIYKIRHKRIITQQTNSGWRQYLGEAALRSAAARELVPAARGDGPDGHGRERDMATGPAKQLAIGYGFRVFALPGLAGAYVSAVTAE